MLADKNRNHLIDLLRFIAATAVILFHLNASIPYVHNIYRDLCKYGFLGVPVFFVVSGYCIRLAEIHSKSWDQFLIRRLLRIFPPYWFSLLIIIIIWTYSIAVTGSSPLLVPDRFEGILANLFLFTNPVTYFPTLNWVYWTLSYELAFYGIIAVTMFFNNNISKTILALLLITAIILPIQGIGLFFFFNELPTFILGYSLYLLLHKTNIINSCLFFLSIASVVVKHPTLPYLIVTFIPCTLLFIEHKKPLKNNFFSKLGDYSYSMYLLHVPILVYILGFVKNIAIIQNNIILNIVTDLFLLSLVIFISKWAFKFIELPSIRLGKQLSKRQNSSSIS